LGHHHRKAAEEDSDHQEPVVLGARAKGRRAGPRQARQLGEPIRHPSQLRLSPSPNGPAGGKWALDGARCRCGDRSSDRFGRECKPDF